MPTSTSPGAASARKQRGAQRPLTRQWRHLCTYICRVHHRHTTDRALGGFASCLIIQSREAPPNALLNAAARTHADGWIKTKENPKPSLTPAAVPPPAAPGGRRRPARASTALEPVPPCTKRQWTERSRTRRGATCLLWVTKAEGRSKKPTKVPRDDFELEANVKGLKQWSMSL